MKTTIRYASLLVLCVMACLSTGNAQKANALYFLSDAPIHTRMNPAMTPKSSGFGLGLSSMSLYMYSDLAVNDLFIPGPNGELRTFLHPEADKQAFLSGLDDVSSISSGMSLEFFTLGIRVKDMYVSMHSSLNLDLGLGIPKDLFSLVMLGMDPNASSNRFDLTDFRFNAMVFNKTGVGFSKSIGDIFTVGANVDYLIGLTNMEAGFNKLYIDANSTEWQVTSNGYFQVAGPSDIQFAYDADNRFNGVDFNSSSSLTNLLNSSIAGSGISVDLGVTVKPLPFLKISAALTDLGAIKWKKDGIQKVSSNGTFTYEGMDLSTSEDEGDEEGNKLAEELQGMVNFTKETVDKGYSSRLTSKLNIGAEAGVLNNKITFGLLSQTGFATGGVYQDVMAAANFKPGGIFQSALTYSLLHGEMSAFGAAVNLKLLFFNLFASADYIPLRYTTNMIPLRNSYFNTQIGFNFMF